MNSSLPAHNQDGNGDYKAAGVAIPVFSLRSKNSSGIGEFSDLKTLADWAHITKQSFIQVLPINDTTMTKTRHDSYPYNAITSFALHPIYLGLHEYPLKNEELNQKYKKEGEKLNALPEVDYDSVIQLKTSYIKDLFAEIGKETLKNEDFLSFYDKNQEWLFPYACFSYFRDLYNTADSSKWEIHRTYDQKELEKLSTANNDMKGALDIVYFTQFLLHKQLVAAKDYAHQKGVKLKGDIPIGISRMSVEAWTEPQLLNLDTQAGAPPDEFSAHGQNWGFPTYNWEEMEKEGFQWWIKRFRKMADYFDAYRIDHLLGFFRIWEIPASSIHALLGYFSPALPLSVEEIRSFGIEFDEERMTKPYIHKDFLEKIFGEYTQEVKEKYLEARKGSELFDLKQEFDTQVKIKEHFGEADDEKTTTIRDGLFDLCNEVLFIRNKKEKDKFHPRIAAKRSYTFKALSEQEQKAFIELDEEFCNNRHTQFWQKQAMKKLPILVHSTEMLACAEDLGMIPASVPPVMKELKLISLEIERMPKTPKRDFEDLTKLPYLSVCTTSSHDINPIRAWWLEDKELTKKYYNEVLEKKGSAPEECTTEICEQILKNHLKSPSMLAIFPLQDWLAIDSRLRRDDPKKERINIPGVSDHYWRYRMHLNLEELVQANDFNSRVKSLVEESNRG